MRPSGADPGKTRAAAVPIDDQRRQSQDRACSVGRGVPIAFTLRRSARKSSTRPVVSRMCPSPAIAVHGQHRHGEDEAGVVDPEERCEPSAVGQGECLLQGEDDEEEQHAQRQQVGVHDGQLGIPDEVLRLGQFPVIQSGGEAQDGYRAAE